MLTASRPIPGALSLLGRERIVAPEKLPLLDLRAVGKHADAHLPLGRILDLQCSAHLGAVRRGRVGHADAGLRLGLRTGADSKSTKGDGKGVQWVGHEVMIANPCWEAAAAASVSLPRFCNACVQECLYGHLATQLWRRKSTVRCRASPSVVARPPPSRQVMIFVKIIKFSLL